MEAQEQAFILSRVIESNRHFENLAANDDFAKWRDTNVIPHIESIRDEVMGIDRSRPDWRERAAEGIVAYQEAKKTYDTLFTLASKNAELARKQLASLQAPREQAS